MTDDALTAPDGSELVDWRALPPGQRRGWWERLWDDAIALADRYRLALRRGWWEDAIQVEALAAFSCWLALYDTGAETDPTGKLQLLWELDRLRLLLRAGDEPFDPAHDRPRFLQHLARTESGRAAPEPDASPPPLGKGRPEELAVVRGHLRDLEQRERVLAQAAARWDADQPRRELQQLRAAQRQLMAREHDLQRHLHTEREA